MSDKKTSGLALRWAVLAKSSSVDRDSNLLSVFEIVEEITFEFSGNKPNIIPAPIQLVSFWEREKAGEELELKLKLIIKDSTGKVLREQDGGLRLEKNHKRTRLRVFLPGIPVTESGVYHFEILSLESSKTNGEKLIAQVPLEITVRSASVKSPLQIK